MTEGKKEVKRRQVSPFHIEIEKRGKGAVMVVTGIIGVSDFSDSDVCLVSHGGRFRIKGSKLSLLTFENRTVEVSGKIEGVELLYGKN